MNDNAIPGLISPLLNPKDAAVAEAAISLVASGQFAHAIALMRPRVEAREVATLRAFEIWYELPIESRPPFWEWRGGSK